MSWLKLKLNVNDDMNYYYISKYEKEAYYDVNDIDEQNKISNENQSYTDYIYIEPNTNQYHANMLFRRLIDYSIDNNFTYSIYDDKNNDYIQCDLMDKTLKKSFYKFCYENS